MQTFQMHLIDGTKVKTECRRFSHYVGAYRYWFALHQERGDAVPTVSHFESGKRVCLSKIGAIVNYSRTDELTAARQAIDALVDKVGAQKVRSVLAASS